MIGPAFAAELFDLMRGSLDELSPQQRRIFELVHGIDTDGAREPVDIKDAASELGLSRGAVRWHLAQAETAVYRAIALHLLVGELSRRDDEAMPEPGPAVLTTDDVGLFAQRHRRAGTGGTVLGERSERHVREAKRSTANGRTDALVLAHQECALA